ncbi:FadR/GntR family transcriptional regulator [Conexibacter woesei]|uniref:Regulatory protein GntR HTH n=1 Tax=Conexibacter woesei (strain DSM 14684 / CCUG 47730 / CIP 108061 / JCM 11494 / NBRC 100937 / ID131577) TaxID=469383 RepID=D3F640_CONWI|nr:GntR family transcriptional regulator [Conexibacter woesei]ADB48713.1 regulatory protein GntR HTH [Conexibacter woesei DSM 14684]
MSTSDTPARRVSDVVHERLRQQILGGDLAVGAAVPSERVLADELGVNRHAVREALKRLEQAGLVQISQGGPTRVRDWRESGGLEVLLDLVDHPGELPPEELVRAVLELRACIGTDAARRCAARAPLAVREQAARLAAATAATAETDPEAAVASYEALWQAIVAGAGNLAHRLALNSLLAALDSFPALAAALLPRDVDSLLLLGSALLSGDDAAAAAAARTLLEADLSSA